MEVLLVVVLCVEEGLGLRDLCGDLTETFFIKFLTKQHEGHRSSEYLHTRPFRNHGALYNSEFLGYYYYQDYGCPP